MKDEKVDLVAEGYRQGTISEKKEGYPTTAQDVHCPCKGCAGKHPRKTTGMQMLTCRLCGHTFNHAENEKPKKYEVLRAEEAARKKARQAKKDADPIYVKRVKDQAAVSAVLRAAQIAASKAAQKG